MTPTNLRRIGPIILRQDEDADVIRALDASGNKAGLIRACIRLAMALPVDGTGDPLTPAEWALIEKAREAK